MGKTEEFVGWMKDSTVQGIGSLAHMLMHKPEPEQVTKRTAYSSENVLQSLEKNASKPCSACGHPERHRAKSGRIYTTLCTKCYLVRNRIAKQRSK